MLLTPSIIVGSVNNLETLGGEKLSISALNVLFCSIDFHYCRYPRRVVGFLPCLFIVVAVLRQHLSSEIKTEPGQSESQAKPDCRLISLR